METPTLNQLSNVLTSTDTQILRRRNVVLRKIVAGIILMFSDLALIAISIFGSLLLRDLLLPGNVDVAIYLNIIPILLALFPIAFYIGGLYPGFGVDVIDELRSLTYSITIVYAVIAASTFLVKESWDYSRIAFILSWIISLLSIPLGRSLVRKILGTKTWWGIPVIVIGAGAAGEKVIKSLKKHYHIGLRPIVAVDDDIDRWGYTHGVPVIGGLGIIPDLSYKMNIDHAIIAMPSIPRKRQQEIIEKYSKYFTQTTVIPDLFGLSSLWVSTKDIGGILGLEVQQKLLKRSSRFKKRVFDLILGTTLSIFALPLCLFVS